MLAQRVRRWPLETLWTFLSDPDNQQTLAWLGGGLAIVAAGFWAVIKFNLSRSSASSKPSISADRGSIAAGRDVKVIGQHKRPRR